MNKVQAKRLLNVAKACRETKVPFSMSNYANLCGTPACAIGNYAARRDLQKTFRLGTSIDVSRVWLLNNGGRALGFTDTEVLDHFGIDADESSMLFDTTGCDYADTGEQAAKYIENFVAERYAP